MEVPTRCTLKRFETGSVSKKREIAPYAAITLPAARFPLAHITLTRGPVLRDGSAPSGGIVPYRPVTACALRSLRAYLKFSRARRSHSAGGTGSQAVTHWPAVRSLHAQVSTSRIDPVVVARYVVPIKPLLIRTWSRASGPGPLFLPGAGFL